MCINYLKCTNKTSTIFRKQLKMALRAVVESMIINKPWRAFINRTSILLFLTQQKSQNLISSSKHGHEIITNVRDYCSGGRIDGPNCSDDQNLSSPPSVATKNIQNLPHEIDLMTISDPRKTDSKAQETTNTGFGNTVIDGSTGEWLTLHQQTNTYPSVRRFTAIGAGGNDFVQSMVVAVESVIQNPIPQEHVKQRVSSRGKYVSVNIGPIRVVSREQVQAVYNAMRSDGRMKFFL